MMAYALYDIKIHEKFLLLEVFHLLINRTTKMRNSKLNLYSNLIQNIKKEFSKIIGKRKYSVIFSAAAT